VRIGPINQVADKDYDVVVSIDVVEHVADPHEFVAHLARIARVGFFLTTPNWTASRCQWPYHLREFTPREFEQLLEPLGTVTLYKGTPNGCVVHPVRHPAAYHAFNALRTLWATAPAAGCVNRLLPAPYKIHSHNAAWVRLA
jgi:2-polyprenyl-3-methyl-5-hydroxy-6-metoxy-1,4-benzoquinol methylase